MHNDVTIFDKTEQNNFRYGKAIMCRIFGGGAWALSLPVCLIIGDWFDLSFNAN